MEAKVTTMATGGSSSKLVSRMHCVTCNIHRSWTPRRWECDVCRDYFLCENCYKVSLDNSEVPSTSSEVRCRDHPMSIHVSNFTCDGCGSTPIWNQRWHCTICVDFQLCEVCHGGLDVEDMPLEHLKEHPMIVVEVICPEMLLKFEPSFTKPMDPQWSYQCEVNSQSYGFMWEKRKPMSKSNLKEESTVNSGNLISEQATQVTQSHGGLDKKHKIFLSHAGAEKDFVEQLFRDLLRVHHFGIFFDKDDDSLPKGEPFPKRILDAAKHCELAIVVISHEYFFRKWPMLELAAFVKAQCTRPELKIFPVFYKLSVEEFKQQQPLFEKRWKEKALVSKDEMDGWKEALKVISQTNGLEYDKRMGEVGFRDRIVEAVHKRVKPELIWDDSHVQGKLRMQETVHESIQLSRNAIGEGLMVSTLRMGLFGMGGSGKTTMCKVLGNQMMPQFLGKVHHMEFGSVDFLHMRTKVLQSVCELDSRFLETVDEGQALTLLKTHMPKQRVCLMIDNVSDNLSCIEEARALLNLPFKEGSLIVVTSRSSIILEALEIERKLTIRVPSLITEEAKAMFSHHARCNTSGLTVEQMKAMEEFVEQCKFRVQGLDSEEYHPLALKVLGSRVGPNAEKWQNIRIDYNYYGNENTHPIFSILRSSFDTLNEKYQRMFLDIAMLSNDCNVNLCMEGLKSQLRFLYGEIDEQFCSQVMEVLQAKSLVEVLDVKSYTIHVHDLYLEFARKEVEKKGLQHSAKCCFSRGLKHGHVVQEGRVRIHNHPISHITKDILSCTICSKAEWLIIEDCANLVSVDVPGMENLMMLHLLGGCPQLTRVSLEGAVNLRSFSWRGFEGKFYPNLTSMESLEVLRLENSKSLATLHGCLDFSKNLSLELLWLSILPLNMVNLNHATLLKKLVLENCQHLERFEGLEALVHLETLWLEACSSLMEFPSLSNFPSLEVFRLDGAAKLKQIQGLANMTALRVLSLNGAMELDELPGIEACTRLSQLWLSCTKIRDCSWITAMKDLAMLSLSGTEIRFVPDCHDLCKLSKLGVDDCQALESIGDNMGLIPPAFPQSLEWFTAPNCPSLIALPEFPSESMLCTLNLHKTSVKDVSGVACCIHLEKMFCGETQITSLPDLTSLTRLEVLDVHGCKLLTRMDNTKSLPALKDLWVYGCTSLLALPDLRSSKKLTVVSLFDCPLVDPNKVELPSASNVDMDMEVVVHDQSEQEPEYLTSEVTDIQEPEAGDDLWRSATLINLVAKVASWCCGFGAN